MTADERCDEIVSSFADARSAICAQSKPLSIMKVDS